MLISCAVTAQLLCAFVFAYAKSRFSHDAALVKLVKVHCKHSKLVTACFVHLPLTRRLRSYQKCFKSPSTHSAKWSRLLILRSQSPLIIYQARKLGQVRCRLRCKPYRDWSPRPVHSFLEKGFSLTLNQEEQVVSYWALNTGELPVGGLPRISECG